MIFEKVGMSTMEILNNLGDCINNINIIDIIQTIIATFIGGYITIHSSKRQERHKTRESLKIDVYKKYNLYFVKIYEKITNLRDKYDYICTMYHFLLLDENYTGGPINFELSTSDLYIKDIYEIETLLDEFVKFIDRELIILEYDINPYKEVKDIFSYELIRIVVGVEFYENAINNFIKPDAPVDVSFIKENIICYNNALKDASNLYSDIDDTLNIMDKIHTKIKNDILGKYFKTKKWEIDK